MQVEKSGCLTLEVPLWAVISVELMEVSERWVELWHTSQGAGQAGDASRRWYLRVPEVVRLGVVGTSQS